MSATESVPQHRSVASIRSPSGSHRHHHLHGGTTTPLRPITSTYGSPSNLRADEEIIIIEFGTRKIHVGFAGDPAPRGTVWFGPEQHRRAGDFRTWQTDYRYDWRSAAAGGLWGKDHELWQYDVRGLDLNLVGDKIERALREAFTKYLLIDSRPRRMVWVLPSALPLPLLSAALDSVFTRFQSPTISLLSSPLSLTVGAGVRSALVVDLGWSETVVTSVYEYREVGSSRSIRGGRLLVEQTHKLLSAHLPQDQSGSSTQDYSLSFEECSDITTRMVWCKPRENPTPSDTTQPSPSEALPTVPEHDEVGPREQPPTEPQRPATVAIPLTSWLAPTTLSLPFDALSEPCEDAFFDTQHSPASFDDHELPLHLLVYRSLLRLPLDVRAICMSRIIFTGGCANVLGLRGRIFDEVSHLVRERGWDPVQGRAVDQLRANAKLNKKHRGGPTGGAETETTTPSSHVSAAGGQEHDGVWHDNASANANVDPPPPPLPETDPIEEQLRRAAGSDKTRRPVVQGRLRAIESVGAWSGASLVTHLKAPALAAVEREAWLAHGIAGASKPAEVDVKVQQRQSLGVVAGGVIRGSSSAAAGGGSGGGAWTLGLWGSV